MALHAHGLERGRGDLRLAGEAREEAPHPEHHRVDAGGIGHLAVPHHVVHDDEAAAPRESERPFEVLGRALLVGVDEDQIERLGLLGRQRRQQIERLADPHLHDVVEVRARQVRARHLGVLGLELERHEASAQRQRASEPDRAVAAERPDLEDAARALRAREEMEQLALVGRDLDLGKTGVAAPGQGFLERRILWHEHLVEVSVDLGPQLLRNGVLRHGGSPAKSFRISGWSRTFTRSGSRSGQSGRVW